MGIRETTLWGVALSALVAFVGCNAGENRAPELSLDVQSQQTYTVGEDIIRVEATATDPDGDAIDFAVDGAPNAPRVNIQEFGNEALFTWNPTPADITDDDPHRLIFSATDSRGAETQRVFSVFIRPGNGAPTFETSSSQIYNLGSDEPFTFEVVVDDPDDESLFLFMDSGPDGATFQETGDMRGEFQWTPSESQRQKRLHTAVFEVDDGDNPPVNLEVSLILRDAEDSPDAGAMCSDDDSLAGNHMRDVAALAELKRYENMELCPGKPDWYQRTIFEGTTLDVTVDGIDGAPLEDVSVEIVDEQGQSVADGTTSDGQVTASFTPEARAQYFVRVAAIAEVSYDVTFAER